MQSRYYDPVIGRFLNADSLLEIDGLKGKNLYVYCYNNPVVLIDCNGERGQKIELGRGWYYEIFYKRTLE